MTPDEELSRLLWDAREVADMFGDVVGLQTGSWDNEARQVRDRIDAYRAARGWSPDGFGGQS